MLENDFPLDLQWRPDPVVLDAKVAEKGLAIVPLKMYFNEDGRVKVELALARGKKLYDKRASMKERDTKREIDRALKERVR